MEASDRSILLSQHDARVDMWQIYEYKKASGQQTSSVCIVRRVADLFGCATVGACFVLTDQCS